MLRSNKIVLFSLLYCFHFLFYAASPLSYSYTGKTCLDNINAGEKVSLVRRDIHVFFWDLFCKKVLIEQTIPDRDESFKFLLRKKRAIIPDNDPTSSKFLKDSASIAEVSFVPSPYWFSFSVTSLGLPKQTKCFPSSCLGRSPPFS